MTTDAWARPPPLGPRTSEPSSSRTIPAGTPVSRGISSEQILPKAIQKQPKNGEPVMVIGGWEEPTLRKTILEEVEVLKLRFNFSTVGEVWTPGRRGKIASMTMHSWVELWRVVKDIKGAGIHPPEGKHLYWAGVSRTQEER